MKHGFDSRTDYKSHSVLSGFLFLPAYRCHSLHPTFIISVLEALKTSPLVPVFYHSELDYAQRVVSACYAGGLRFFEFTNRGEAALEVFRGLKKHVLAHCRGMKLGAGTIYGATDAARFLEAGADFVVQPITEKAVGELCRQAGKPWIPGALTPNEIWAAWQSGAAVVKVFPAGAVDPDYIRAIRGPMPGLPIMVTGGVSCDAGDIRKWLDAGVQAVGLGSQLFKGDFSTDFSALSRRIADLVESVRT